MVKPSNTVLSLMTEAPDLLDTLVRDADDVQQQNSAKYSEQQAVPVFCARTPCQQLVLHWHFVRQHGGAEKRYCSAVCMLHDDGDTATADQLRAPSERTTAAATHASQAQSTTKKRTKSSHTTPESVAPPAKEKTGTTTTSGSARSTSQASSTAQTKPHQRAMGRQGRPVRRRTPRKPTGRPTEGQTRFLKPRYDTPRVMTDKEARQAHGDTIAALSRFVFRHNLTRLLVCAQRQLPAEGELLGCVAFLPQRESPHGVLLTQPAFAAAALTADDASATCRLMQLYEPDAIRDALLGASQQQPIVAVQTKRATFLLVDAEYFLGSLVLEQEDADDASAPPHTD
jgi:hypothetical protein